jgi:DNA-binding NarL/FixJ family response regulator
MVRVLIADDRSEVRSALRLLLEQEACAQVVGEIAAAHDLGERLCALRPDVVLLDWELPGLSDPAALRSLHLAQPQARIIVLSSLPEVSDAALAAGADAFVSKVEPPEQLLAALRALVGASALDQPCAGDGVNTRGNGSRA